MSHRNTKAFDAAVEITNTFVSTFKAPNEGVMDKYAEQITGFFNIVFDNLVAAEDKAMELKN